MESKRFVIRTALSASMASDASPIFTPLLTRFMTEMFVTSLPVPQVVGTIINGCLFSSSLTWSYKSSTFSSGAATAPAFAISITVPPPIATIRSKFLSRSASRIASTAPSVGSPFPYFSRKSVCTPSESGSTYCL